MILMLMPICLEDLRGGGEGDLFQNVNFCNDTKITLFIEDKKP